MLFHPWLAATILMLSSAGSPFVEPMEFAHPDYARFQGTWSILSVECGGKKEEEDTEKFGFSFLGNTMFFLEHGAVDAVVGFTLDETQGRKRITFARVKGLYEFQNEHLHICYTLDGKRPTELITTEDRPNEVLMILKKAIRP